MRLPLAAAVIVHWLAIHKRALLIGSILGVLACSAAHAQAASVSVAWTLPSTNTDGSALASTAILGTRVEWGTCSSAGVFGTKGGEVGVSGAATTASVTLGAGTYCFRAYTRSAAGESGPSNVASKTITAPAPNPPVLTTIAVAAYDVKWSGTLYAAFRQVGTLPLGSPCGTEVKTASGFGTVNPSLVTFSRTPRTSTLVARCG